MSTPRPTLNFVPGNTNTANQALRKRRILNNAGTQVPKMRAEIPRIQKILGVNYLKDPQPGTYESPIGFFGLNPAKHPNSQRPTNRFRFPFARRAHPHVVLPPRYEPLPSSPVNLNTIQEGNNNASSVNSKNSVNNRVISNFKLNFFSPTRKTAKGRRARKTRKSRR